VIIRAPSQRNIPANKLKIEGPLRARNFPAGDQRNKVALLRYFYEAGGVFLCLVYSWLAGEKRDFISSNAPAERERAKDVSPVIESSLSTLFYKATGCTPRAMEAR